MKSALPCITEHLDSKKAGRFGNTKLATSSGSTVGELSFTNVSEKSNVNHVRAVSPVAVAIGVTKVDCFVSYVGLENAKTHA